MNDLRRPCSSDANDVMTANGAHTEPQASRARSRQQDSPEMSGSGNGDLGGMTQPSPGTTNAMPGELVTDPSHDDRTFGYGGTTPSSYQSPHPAATSDPDPTTMPCSRWPGSGCGGLPGPRKQAIATPGFLQG